VLLTRIDALHRGDHVRLADDDECYFLREYIPRGGYQAGETNSLISNLKKSPAKKGKPEWKYKRIAIRQAARELREAIDPRWLSGATLVPVPPSKVHEDEEYDDRMVQVVEDLCLGTGAEARQLLRQRVSTEPSHRSERSRDVEQLVANLEVDPTLAAPTPARIGIFDDVLTTGAHYRAARIVLSHRFPQVPVVGFFIARRVIIEDDWVDADNDF
jgi:hypothetical protein